MPFMEFVELPGFTADVRAVASDEELREFQS
jgi:hypothetical protein